MSQKPSAAEASTGPNRRAVDTASAAIAKKVPHGTSRRPLRHAAVSHDADCVWLPTMTLMTIAPIMATLKIAMYASWSTSRIDRVARPWRQDFTSACRARSSTTSGSSSGSQAKSHSRSAYSA